MRTVSTLAVVAIFGTVLGTKPASGQITAQQGLTGTPLVAGKTTAMRIVTDSNTASKTTRIEASILRPDGSRLSRSWTRSNFLSLQDGSGKPNLLIRLPGTDLPWVGNYSARVTLVDAQAKVLQKYTLAQIDLLPTKDLHFIITYLFKGTGSDAYKPTASWDSDIQLSMNRLGSMFPVRDGVQNSLNGTVPAGIRYSIGTACDGYIAGYYDCVYKQTRAINASSGDHIDVSVEFRPGIFTPVCRESPCGPGGNSARPPSPYGDLPRASCVAGNWQGIEMTAPCIAQETGHNFGLEPNGSPHFQDVNDPGHSKDPFIVDPGAFDFVNNRVFVRVGDTMNNLSGGAFQGRDSVMFNAFDWDYLRKKIADLPNSGPTVADHFVTDAGPALAAAGNTVFFFARRSDGRVYYNSATLGQAGRGWREMDGNMRTNVSPSAGAVGTHLFVAITGVDGNIYMNQADVGQPFVGWSSMNFHTDVPTAVASVGNSIFVFAKSLDKRIYLNQAVLGKSFSGWFEVQGDGRTDAGPSAAAVKDHIFVAILGLNGTIQLNQTDFGHAFGQWFPVTSSTNVSPGLTAVGRSIFIFAKGADQRVYLSQAELGKAFSPRTEVQGHGQTNAAPSATTIGNHVFVGITGLDGTVLTNQADFGHAFGGWFP